MWFSAFKPQIEISFEKQKEELNEASAHSLTEIGSWCFELKFKYFNIVYSFALS